MRQSLRETLNNEKPPGNGPRGREEIRGKKRKTLESASKTYSVACSGRRFQKPLTIEGVVYPSLSRIERCPLKGKV